MMREHFSLLNLESKGSIAGIFVAFLRQGPMSEELKGVLVKYVGQCLLSNNLTSFRRGVALLEHLGTPY